MQSRVSKPWFYLVAVLVAVLVAGIAVAGDEETVKIEKKIVIKGAHGMGHGGAFLGVGLSPLTPELRTHFGVPEDLGVMVSKVEADSPAALAGVEVGDIIARVGGDDIGSASALAHNIRRRAEGDAVELEVWRDGRVEMLSATLAARQGMGDHGMGHHGMGHHQMIVTCDDEEDCGHLGDFDCGNSKDGGGAEECRVEVRCDGGDCECTANGDAIDCESLPMHGMHPGVHHGEPGDHHIEIHRLHHGDGDSGE